MFCRRCGGEVPAGAEFCPNCGAPAPGPMEFSVSEVLSGSFGVIRRKPIVLLPQLVTTIISVPFLILLLPGFVVPGVEAPSAADFASFLAAIVSFVLIMMVIGFTISGMYPLMVKDVLKGRDVDVYGAFRAAVRRLPSLIAASILVALLVAAGFILLIVPGIIFLTWYYYTIPAIMLEDRGALNGMSASRAFGRTRKWKTFLMLLVLFLIGGIAGAFNVIPVVGWVIAALLGLLIAVWGAVIPAYAYIRYAMPAAP